MNHNSNHSAGAGEAQAVLKKLALRDLFKERWAVNKKKAIVIRLLQDDVWRNRGDWQSYIQSAVADALRDPTPRVVVRVIRS